MEHGVTGEQLAETLERYGITLEYRDLSDDDIAIQSGLCDMGGKKTLIIDTRLGQRARIGVMAEALKTLDLEGIYLPPAIRALLEGNNR